MKPVIKLAIETGNFIYFNTSKIANFWGVPDGGTCLVIIDGDSYDVKETPEEILAKMEVEA